MFTFLGNNPGKTLAPWVLEQESYLPYIKKVIKKILETTGPSHSSWDAIIIFLFLKVICIILHNGQFSNLKRNQLLSKKRTTLHTFSTMHDIMDVSYTYQIASCNFFWLFLTGWIGILLSLPSIYLVTETNSFILLKLVIQRSNLKLK